MGRDYYKILNVEKTADDAELKKGARLAGVRGACVRGSARARALMHAINPGTHPHTHDTHSRHTTNKLTNQPKQRTASSR